MDSINSSPYQMYSELQSLGKKMFRSNNMPKSEVITFCATMLKLYEYLEKNG